MGLISLLITVLVMILGAGYFLLGSGGESVTVENTNVSEQGTANSEPSSAKAPEGQGRGGSIASFEAIKNQAEGVKDMVEKRATETMEQGIGSSEQETSKTADAPLKSGTTAPQSEKTEMSIIEKKVDFGFGVPEQKRTIDTIVLHASYNSLGGDVYSVDKVIAIWKSYEVAPHYMIDRKGNIYQLVLDTNIAYHAGISKMPDGRTNVNDFSIGVEILNTKDDKYTTAQYDAVNDLIAYLKGKHSIKTVVGHADIAPGRKDDPWHFDWKKIKYQVNT